MRRALLLALLLVPLVAGGTADDPEITDAAGDQTNSDAGFGRIDIVAAWVHKETTSSVVFAIQTASEPASGAVGPGVYRFHFTYGETAMVASGTVGESDTTAGDAATSAQVVGSVLMLDVPREAFGDLVPGTMLTGLFAESDVPAGGSGPVASEDRAPDADFGRDYMVGTTAEDDVDYDGDGLGDAAELTLGTDPTNPDSDGDGVSDGDEVAAGTSPLVADTDGDGLSDGEEAALGTNATSSDTDGDGLTDGEEVMRGTDPLLADTDGDGLTDGSEVASGTDPLSADSDGDGLTDGEEVALGTDPNNADTDNDGLSDGEEAALADRDPLNGNDAIEASSAPLDLPGWLWIFLIILAVLLLLLLVAYVIVIIVARRREEEDEDEEDEDRPFALTPEYLREGLTDEEIASARRRFEERERRYIARTRPEQLELFEAELAIRRAKEEGGTRKRSKRPKRAKEPRHPKEPKPAKEPKKRARTKQPEGRDKGQPRDGGAKPFAASEKKLGARDDESEFF